jgi:NAD+ kinase
LDRKVQNVLIIANLHKPRAGHFADHIAAELGQMGLKTTCFKFNGNPGPIPPDDYDLAFSLGGDGTVLFASRVLSDQRIPIIGVNMGDFGFLTEISENEWREAFDDYRSGKLDVAERIVLGITVERDGTTIATPVGLNDLVISAAGISKIIRLSVDLGSMSLGQYRADGIIVATPTGSTAHSAAAGGPILDPRMDAMVINPICPFTLSHRPIVVPGYEQITIRVDDTQRTDVHMTVDGQTELPLEPGDRLTVRRSEACALIVRARTRNFYDVLRNKLKWSGGPESIAAEEGQ